MKAKPKRKSKGKRHPVHAETLDLLADALSLSQEGLIGRQEMIKVLRDEADRVRTILR